jgi:hypothetical protein
LLVRKMTIQEREKVVDGQDARPPQRQLTGKMPVSQNAKKTWNLPALSGHYV